MTEKIRTKDYVIKEGKYCFMAVPKEDIDRIRKKKRLSDKQVRVFLFGWLWTEENIMKPAREKIKLLNNKKR